MAPKDFLDHCDKEIDEDLEIIEEILTSSSLKKRTQFNQVTPAQLSLKHRAKEELKQANSKISQQKDTILELQQKLNYQNEKLQTSTQIMAHQKRLLQTAQRDKLKLRRDIALQKKRDKEKLFKLLDFFKHINSEFSFAIDVLNGNKATELNSSKSPLAKTVTQVEPQLKQLSIDLKNKLEKLKSMEKKRIQELYEAKKKLSKIPVQKSPTRTSASTQTTVTSVDINNYVRESISLNQAFIPNANPGPLRLRFKRSYNDYKLGGKNSIFESPPISPSEYLKEIKDANPTRINSTSKVLAMNNTYYSSTTKHELDTTKQNSDLFYCTCGLTFTSEKWLGYHTNLFLTFYSGDVKEQNQGFTHKPDNNQANQASVIVNNMQKY